MLIWLSSLAQESEGPLDEVKAESLPVERPSNPVELATGPSRGELGQPQERLLLSFPSVLAANKVEDLGRDDDLTGGLKCSHQVVPILSILRSFLDPDLDVLVGVHHGLKEPLLFDACLVPSDWTSLEVATDGVKQIAGLLVKLLEGVVDDKHLVDLLDVQLDVDLRADSRLVDVEVLFEASPKGLLLRVPHLLVPTVLMIQDVVRDEVEILAVRWVEVGHLVGRHSIRFELGFLRFPLRLLVVFGNFF